MSQQLQLQPNRFNSKVNVHISRNGGPPVVMEFGDLQQAHVWIHSHTHADWTRKSFASLAAGLEEAVRIDGIRFGNVCAAYRDDERFRVFYGSVII